MCLEIAFVFRLPELIPWVFGILFGRIFSEEGGVGFLCVRGLVFCLVGSGLFGFFVL